MFTLSISLKHEESWQNRGHPPFRKDMLALLQLEKRHACGKFYSSGEKLVSIPPHKALHSISNIEWEASRVLVSPLIISGTELLGNGHGAEGA